MALVGCIESALLPCQYLNVGSLVFCDICIVPHIGVTVSVQNIDCGGGGGPSAIKILRFSPMMVVPPNESPGLFYPLTESRLW